MIKSIARYFMFKKMGIKGYKAFVPFYASYLIYKNCYKEAPYWIVFSFSILMVILSAISTAFFSVICGLIVFGLAIPVCILEIKCQYRMARSFNGDKGFGVFAVFFETIASYIIAFDSEYKYIGNWTEIKENSEKTE